jgi:hypothetical protein
MTFPCLSLPSPCAISINLPEFVYEWSTLSKDDVNVRALYSTTVHSETIIVFSFQKFSLSTLQTQNAENLKQIFPEKEYRGLSPNFHIHVSVSELYIPTTGLPFLLE